ncbi:MAG: DUF4892 domain-containing protein [Halioglobus sp.]|nr:DUF4892 domain-containing protein [Halioglobus sp.]
MLLIAAHLQAARVDAAQLLDELNTFPHVREISHFSTAVLNHEIGLGAIQKVRGEWRFKSSERVTGILDSYTWQVADGFTSNEMMGKLLARLDTADNAKQLFFCQGRSCGHSAQWANRVFKERLLYGKQDWQQYAVYQISGKPEYRLMIYSAARSEDRQYLRVELLSISG